MNETLAEAPLPEALTGSDLFLWAVYIAAGVILLGFSLGILSIAYSSEWWQNRQANSALGRALAAQVGAERKVHEIQANANAAMARLRAEAEEEKEEARKLRDTAKEESAIYRDHRDAAWQQTTEMTIQRDEANARAELAEKRAQERVRAAEEGRVRVWAELLALRERYDELAGKEGAARNELVQKDDLLALARLDLDRIQDCLHLRTVRAEYRVMRHKKRLTGYAGQVCQDCGRVVDFHPFSKDAHDGGNATGEAPA